MLRVIDGKAVKQRTHPENDRVFEQCSGGTSIQIKRQHPINLNHLHVTGYSLKSNLTLECHIRKVDILNSPLLAYQCIKCPNARAMGSPNIVCNEAVDQELR